MYLEVEDHTKENFDQKSKMCLRFDGYTQKKPISNNAYLRKRLPQITPISENAFLLKCLPELDRRFLR